MNFYSLFVSQKQLTAVSAVREPFSYYIQMQKQSQSIKSISSDQQDTIRTKPKFAAVKIKANEKPTVASHGRASSHNQFASQLQAQSAIISDQSSLNPHDSSVDSDEVLQIDPLCVYGTIENVHQLNEEMKKKYSLQTGYMLDIKDYRVIFAGRHQVMFRNGLKACLYVPPAYKSARDSETHKVEVLIERKMKQEQKDPMQYPYLILDPSNSLYPTYICTWIECKRKITLEHYIEYNQKTNVALTLGNTIHHYLEWLIRKQVEPQPPTDQEMRRLYEAFLYDMFIIDMQYQVFVSMAQPGIANLVQWYRKHVVQGTVVELNKWQKKYLKITRVLGSEVMIKSKYFGIRGKVDGLFEGQYNDGKANQKYNVVVPFQLKTGRKVLDSHRKQIDFYNLLLRQSKCMPVVGLLFYSESSMLEHRMENPLICFQNFNVHRNKIILNILNLYAEESIIKLPELPQTFDQCKLCNVTIECAVNRMEEIKDLEDICDEVPEKYNIEIRQKIKALSILELKYLKKWTLLLHLEQQDQKLRNQANTTKSYYSNIKLPAIEIKKFAEYNPGQTICLSLLKKIESHEMSQELDNYFRVGEKLRIFIPLIRLSDGCRIANIFKNTKIFQIQVEIRSESIKFNRNKCVFLLEDEEVQEIEVEMEKYENSFYNYTRGYCYKFVTEASSWLKSIIIQETYESPQQQFVIKTQMEEMNNLNDDQSEAFLKCVHMDKFCLIEGMPGTGKTQLIIKLVQYYYRTGRTVLVTSFTNQALSNILERQLSQHKVISSDRIIREGSKFGIAKQFEHLSSQSQEYKSIAEYKAFFSSKKVWFVTMASLYLQHLPEKFDVVIIDEASQCLEPNCLEALIKAEKFIMIGDEKQLQPVVKSKQAIKKQMQISLFQRLCKMYPDLKATLRKQYRMSPAIMNLTNSLVYGGELQLAKAEMSKRVLKLPEDWRKATPSFLHSVLDPSNSVRFINYDNALNLFSEADNVNIRKVKRLLQIKITCCLYKQFRSLGIKKQDILIISAYNSLVHQLVGALKKQKLIEENNSDVLTIDKSQGTDKEIIIFIFHQGNRELIENYRRLNVALTRAKNKFIIVGSLKELRELATWTGRLAKLLLPDEISIEKEFLEVLLNNSYQK